MIEVVPESNYDSQHHFISEFAWDHRRVLDKIATDCHRWLPNDRDRGLIVDESAHLKKGNHYVGVQRQWCGRFGKVDNCQIGIYSALVHREQMTLIDSRLYLPKSWINDPRRCKMARIPPEEIDYNSICDIALKSIRHQRKLGVDFNWVGLDGGYGK